MFSGLRKSVYIQAGPLFSLSVRSNEALTAAASTGSPFWNFARGSSLKVQTVASSLTVQDVASQGLSSTGRPRT